MSATTVRDSVTGATVTASHDGHFITVSDDGVIVLHLSRSAALELAQQLVAAASA